MILFAGLIAITIPCCVLAAQDRVLLADVQTLTLSSDGYTTGRRSNPVPQIECESGCYDFTPDVVQCYNRGSDGFDVNWKCDAQLPNGMSFSKVAVGCEGYDYPDDPYILRGSCQVIFSLKGSGYSSASSYQTGHRSNSYYSSYGSNAQSYGTSGSSGISTTGQLLLGAIFVYILYSIFRHFSRQQGPSQHQQAPSSAFGSGDAYPAPPRATGSGWGMPSMGGFWGGMGLGGVLGSLLGRRGYGGYGGYGHPRYRSGWGGWGGSRFGNTSYRQSSYPSSASSSRRTEGTSSQSGYGTTRRR